MVQGYGDCLEAHDFDDSTALPFPLLHSRSSVALASAGSAGEVLLVETPHPAVSVVPVLGDLGHATSPQPSGREMIGRANRAVATETMGPIASKLLPRPSLVSLPFLMPMVMPTCQPTFQRSARHDRACPSDDPSMLSSKILVSASTGRQPSTSTSS